MLYGWDSPDEPEVITCWWCNTPTSDEPEWRRPCPVVKSDTIHFCSDDCAADYDREQRCQVIADAAGSEIKALRQVLYSLGAAVGYWSQEPHDFAWHAMHVRNVAEVLATSLEALAMASDARKRGATHGTAQANNPAFGPLCPRRATRGGH